VILLARRRDLLDDVAILVDLDRVDALVVPLVSVLGDGAPKGLVELDNAVLEDVAEADEQRQVDAAPPHLVDQLLHIDGGSARSVGGDRDIAALVYAEVPASPGACGVDLGRVSNRPTSGDSSGCGHRSFGPPRICKPMYSTRRRSQ
jgi:hypothetical protein